MSEFLTAYPDYASTARLDELRAAEYSYLDSAGHIYLDYTGAGLAADAQVRAQVQRLNPAAAAWRRGSAANRAAESVSPAVSGLFARFLACRREVSDTR